jgi:hypothetical protein
MNGNLSASDVMALTNSHDTFGGIGGFILLFIFLMAISGNGFGFGGSNTALGLADIQASLYNQTQDANSRTLQSSIANVNDSVLVGKYDNAIMMKDISNQLSNSIAGLSNQISNQTNTILGAMNENVINDLRDKLAVTRDELSNTRQTAVITENILSNLATTAPKPPCYYSCGCGCGNTSLY